MGQGLGTLGPLGSSLVTSGRVSYTKKPIVAIKSTSALIVYCNLFKCYTRIRRLFLARYFLLWLFLPCYTEKGADGWFGLESGEPLISPPESLSEKPCSFNKLFNECRSKFLSWFTRMVKWLAWNPKVAVKAAYSDSSRNSK